MRTRLELLLLMLCLPLLPTLLLAGECRALVQPLLLQANPDSAELARSRALCRSEADAGDPEATYQLALFSLGLAGNWQPDEAIPLVQSAANDGVPEAQYWLAWQSEAGPALPHDRAIALAWYQKAADGNHRLALQRLADAWEHGELGLPVNGRKSLEYRARIRRCEEETARNRN